MIHHNFINMLQFLEIQRFGEMGGDAEPARLLNHPPLFKSVGTG